jgi:hypothetical protein
MGLHSHSHQSLVNLFGAVIATAFTTSFMILDIANSIFRGCTMSISIMVEQNLGTCNRDIAKKNISLNNQYSEVLDHKNRAWICTSLYAKHRCCRAMDSPSTSRSL